jgi:hypothetical protein
MTRFWPTIPASLALLISMGSASAAPLRPEMPAGPQPMIEKVHGFHRSCAYSSGGGWHRHIRPYNGIVSCGSPYYYDPFWGSPGITFWFGPSPRYYRDRPRGYYRYQRPRRDGDRRRR